MKRGDVVTIYQDPITKQKPEGKAKLVKQISTAEGGLERWTVQFVSDGFVCERNLDGTL
jgi:hypothetical protein